MIGSILSGISGALSAGAGLTGSILNYNMAKDTLNYQKNLQQQIFNREDNAVQRRVADLKAAGLSPTLAAGSAAGAGSAINVSSPELNTNQFASALTDAVNNAVANYKHSEESKLLRTQRDKTSADSEYTKVQTANAVKQGSIFDWQLNKLVFDSAQSALNLSMLEDKVKLFKKYGYDVDKGLTGSLVGSLGKFLDKIMTDIENTPSDITSKGPVKNPPKKPLFYDHSWRPSYLDNNPITRYGL